MRLRAGWASVLVVALVLVSCGKTAPSMVPTQENMVSTPVPDAAATQTPAQPVATVIPAATTTVFARRTSTPSTVDSVDATAIAATSEAVLVPTATPNENGETNSMQGETAVFELMDSPDGPFFVSLTMGMIVDEQGSEGALSYHPVTVFQKTAGGLQKISEYDFKDGQYIGTIEPLPIDAPGKAFFTVTGGVGAHSSFGHVFSFDGTALKLEYTANSDAGGNALQVIDVNGDGVLDLVGDATDYYVFCYACGVRSFSEEVYAWDGTAFVKATPAASADPHLQAAVDASLYDRWNVVAAELTQAAKPSSAQDIWTAALLRRIADQRTPKADDASPFMSALLFGDYDAAVKVLRRTKPTVIVDVQAADFPADLRPFGEAVIENVVRLSTTVLAKEELPSARFLRGWAQTLMDPQNAAGRKDLEAVASVDPFYAAVLEAVKKR